MHLDLELFAATRLNSLLLTREQDIFVDHLQWVRLIPQKNKIAGRPEIFGKILVFELREILENLFGSVFSNGAEATGRWCGWRDAQDPLHVIGPDGQVIEPPCKGYANVLHPKVQGFGNVSDEVMGAETRDHQTSICQIIGMCRYRLKVNLVI